MKHVILEEARNHVALGFRSSAAMTLQISRDLMAIAGDAAVIVTRNLRDLRGAELRFEPLRILSPEDLLKEL